MNQETLEQILSTPVFSDISNSKEFYFQKGQDALKKWLDTGLSNELQSILLKLSGKYEQIQAEAKNNTEIAQVLELLFLITSYCDSNAKDKNIYNQYDDKRVLALAFVRMGHWARQLILYKLAPEQLGAGSVKNAIEYLLDPKNNSTTLSENHRELIARNLLKKEYNPGSFIIHLKQWFQQYQVTTVNPDNYTHLITRVLYQIDNEWKEEVVGLMASDGTDWQSEHSEYLQNYEASVIWNSKRPSGTTTTLKFLRGIVNDGGTFNFYYSKGGFVNYKAIIVDFAENQVELNEKDWSAKYRVLYFNHEFASYRDNNKSAKIVFLCKSLNEIEPIPISAFTFYNGYSPPTQDNLSPIKRESVTKDKSNEMDLGNSETNATQTMKSLNQIFYGPPGTGKTYNTINRALEILEEDISGKTREEIKNHFDERVNEGSIQFTTFHQSMSYEDFIEGIKPDSGADKKVRYVIKPGIFKQICYKALQQTFLANSEPSEDNEISFDVLYEDFVKELQRNYKQDEYPFTTKEGSVLRPDKKELDNGQIVVYYKWSNAATKQEPGKTPFPIKKEKLRKMFEGGITMDETNLKARLKPIIGYHLSPHYGLYKSFLNFAKSHLPAGTNLSEADLDTTKEELDYEKYLDQILVLKKQKGILKKGKPFVLIIDEINRGNVSQIFGELITLLEEDKRLGNNEGLTIKLPYSKSYFAVPNNLYIIGTMNTADRSVEALDTALRRRFSFTEMTPDPLLVSPMETLRRFWLDNLGVYDGSKQEYDKHEHSIRHLLGMKILNDEAYRTYGNDEIGDYSEKTFAEKLYGILSFDGVDLSKLLTTINHRIEKLLDRDHQIGHSYFMKVFSWDDLQTAFYNAIIPLLQEYFFGAYHKMGLVLGKGFVEKTIEKTGEKVFADFEDAVDFDDIPTYRIVDYRSGEKSVLIGDKLVQINFQNAIQLLMNQPIV